MTEQPSRKRLTHLKTLFASLRQVLEGIPSDQERAASAVALRAVIELLQHLESTLSSLPRDGDKQRFAEALAKVEQLLQQADIDRHFATAVGLQRPSRARTRPTMVDSDIEYGRAEVARLGKMQFDEIRSNLDRTSLYPLTALRSMSAALGLNTTPRTARNALVHQIAMHIANQKGYAALRGDLDDQPVSRAVVAERQVSEVHRELDE